VLGVVIVEDDEYNDEEEAPGWGGRGGRRYSLLGSDVA